jgi:hypothetical protein
LREILPGSSLRSILGEGVMPKWSTGASAVLLTCLGPPSAGVALAQAPPPAAEQVAAARAEGDKLIAKTGHAELFENVTDGELIRIRHKLSGAICTFHTDDVDHGLEVIVRDLKPGEDVFCHANGKVGVGTGLTVARFGRKIPLDLTFEAASAAFRAEQARSGAVTEAKGAFDGPMPAGVIHVDLPPSKTVRFVVSARGGNLFARREVTQIGDWTVLSDFIVPGSPAIRDTLGRIVAMGDFKPIADAQKAP